ncbi:MAG: hypothetical protein GC179_01040 [Anaerolineaceae bacterium]|nr:hypothetical protein [Anaerolineaceae bacterium]
MTTVITEQIDSNIIKMTWANKVNDNDVRKSFKEINQILNDSARPMFVMVNIMSDPQFPIGATLTSALFGPYRHPRLQEWLIVGTNRTAQFIERTLAAATGNSNVRWFTDEAEAIDYAMQVASRAS